MPCLAQEPPSKQEAPALVEIPVLPPSGTPTIEAVSQANKQASELDAEVARVAPPLQLGSCENSFRDGFLCPNNLPHNPEIQGVCRLGCYLVAPEDMQSLYWNNQRAGLIPSLVQQRNLFQQQRDKALLDSYALRPIAQELYRQATSYQALTTKQQQQIQTLTVERDSRFGLGYVVLATLAGALVGGAGMGLYTLLSK